MSIDKNQVKKVAKLSRISLDDSKLEELSKDLDSILNFVEELNKDYVNFKIKYLGKLEKLIFELKNENINLNFVNDEWVIKLL